ncbi:MAG: bifunctional 3,4-dihydroxy-2-butanone 4-phosphate synthase/GTP cyclohydrolase [Burkholderiales bacterium]|jgi:3,4-dihydroxy 2-butanone 4-phosphate synthase/GTP cyclohydrolase II|nr:bifunctional 3,4-dihydroxy-2-butanone 4-phosphate synthase/GTP cyclohydrolase [Burkholderiales bacterium]
MFDTIESALADLKQGKIIIICDDEGRENEGDFVALAEFVTPELVNFMVTHGRGLLCMPITEECAARLNLPAMAQVNTDRFNTAFTVSIDHVSNSTGISASDRATTIQKVIDENITATDFRRPGHIFPIIAKPGGVLQRHGHTEAVVDLARLAGKKPAGFICEIMNADGTMARRDDLLILAKIHNLKIITIKDLIEYRKRYNTLIQREAEARLPTSFGDFNITGYTNLIDSNHHIAITKGNFSVATAPLVRIHSECLTGDVFHSKRCDCGEQLDLALKLIEKEQLGAVIYMRQEGRGIGLINKIKAYKLQEAGMDTAEANRALGFADDLREYFLAAQILLDLGIHEVRLMTNNPDKISALEEHGIKVVERVPIKTTEHPENKNYLQTKSSKLGHLL